MIGQQKCDLLVQVNRDLDDSECPYVYLQTNQITNVVMHALSNKHRI
jgi:hypothetical protein